MAGADDVAVEGEYALAEEEVVEGEGRSGVWGEPGGSRSFCRVGSEERAGAEEVLVDLEHTEYNIYKICTKSKIGFR